MPRSANLGRWEGHVSRHRLGKNGGFFVLETTLWWSNMAKSDHLESFLDVFPIETNRSSISSIFIAIFHENSDMQSSVPSDDKCFDVYPIRSHETLKRRKTKIRQFRSLTMEVLPSQRVHQEKGGLGKICKCAIGSINSHYFHIIGDGKINPIIGFYIPIIRIPIKGGMTIPNIATFDHGTSDLGVCGNSWTAEHPKLLKSKLETWLFATKEMRFIQECQDFEGFLHIFTNTHTQRWLTWNGERFFPMELLSGGERSCGIPLESRQRLVDS